MKKTQKLKLEMIRSEIISVIITRQNDQKLDTKTAFSFIDHVNNLSHDQLNDLVIEAAIHQKSVALIAIEGIPLPF